jgi:1-pyrroline-5-carboxylate dehydrogenase
MSEFVNERTLDFTLPANRRMMEQALGEVRAEAGRTWPLVIGGKDVETSATFVSTNPARPSETLGTFAKAGEVEAEAALVAAWAAFPGWRETRAADRAAVLSGAASLLRERRFRMNAAMVLEVGKSWAEADADTAEAIDFLEFYAREAVRYAGEQPLTRLAGERNELRYVPLGAGVVVPPWNFPCAILTGMTTAAVVAGNTVVLKPSSEAPLTARMSFQLLLDAGLPPGVVNFLTGPGVVAGEFLVGHPRTRFVAFTGSLEIGLRVNALAAQAQPGQIWIKRVAIEMGGKNAIVVDDPCDVDAAVAAVVASAFGYQGQKCSACSRAIVSETLYDEFIEKLVVATRAIRMGDPADPATVVGPVISAAAMEKILSYIECGRREGTLLTGGRRAGNEGYFVEPTIFENVAPTARIAQEEIFGPVLAVMKARDFDHALDLANGTAYGLTGAVFSDDRARLDLAASRFHVGNLYFNRKCTGALVGVHPFGGFHLSGTDTKAGGRDYLLQFLQAKAISEKIAG